jgi:exopolysaccharide biosynthesis polyprenyl glycosylphosphotransferase
VTATRTPARPPDRAADELESNAAPRAHVGATASTPGVTHRAAPRPHRGRALARGVIAAGDILGVALAWAVTRPPSGEGVAFIAVLAVALIVSGAHRLRSQLQAAAEVPAHVARVALALFLAGLVAHGLSSSSVRLAALTALLVVSLRAVAYAIVRGLRRRGVVAERTLLLGSGRVAAAIARQLSERTEHGFQLVGYVDDHPNDTIGVPRLGTWRDLDAVIAECHAARVVIAFSPTKESQLVDVARRLTPVDVDVDVVPRFFELGVDAAWQEHDSVSCIPLQRLRPAGTRRWSWKAKRAFDVVVSGAALLVLLPGLAACALAVRLTSEGPILFRQQRVGQHGRTFELLKFRTMHVNDDSDTRWSVVHDDRQTRVGAWMRRFSVDELPQLWNVLRGDMSLIGPRPERPHFVRQFCLDVPTYGARHRFPVGLTGWAQVNGLRGDTSIAERARYDNHYIDHWSLLRDLSILAATAAAVLRDARSKTSA